MKKDKTTSILRAAIATVISVLILFSIPSLCFPSLLCGSLCSRYSYACYASNKPLIDDFEEVRDDFQLVADALMEIRAEYPSERSTALGFVICSDSETAAKYLGCSESGLDALTDGDENAAFQRVCAAFDNDFSLEYVDVYNNCIYFIARTGNFAVYYSADGTRPDKSEDSFRIYPLDRIVREDRHWYQMLIF